MAGQPAVTYTCDLAGRRIGVSGGPAGVNLAALASASYDAGNRLTQL